MTLCLPVSDAHQLLEQPILNPLPLQSTVSSLSGNIRLWDALQAPVVRASSSASGTARDAQREVEGQPPQQLHELTPMSLACDAYPHLASVMQALACPAAVLKLLAWLSVI